MNGESAQLEQFADVLQRLEDVLNHISSAFNPEEADKRMKAIRRIEELLLYAKSVYNLDEAADYVGITKHMMYRHTAAGRIPFSRPNGKMIYFSREALDTWLLSNKVQTKEDIDVSAETYLATRQNRKRH